MSGNAAGTLATMAEIDAEIEFLRSVEDAFAGCRGVPHVLSPKDVQLARTWFAEGVPLAAVVAGVTEALEKKRAQSDGDVVVSLSYCRHAVRRHARRIADSRVGTAGTDGPPMPDLGPLLETLARAAGSARDRFPDAALEIEAVAGRLEAARDQPAEALEEFLYALEAELLRRCRDALPAERRTEIETAAASAAGRSTQSVDGRERISAAHRDRLTRQLLALPRFELP